MYDPTLKNLMVGAADNYLRAQGWTRTPDSDMDPWYCNPEIGYGPVSWRTAVDIQKRSDALDTFNG